MTTTDYLRSLDACGEMIAWAEQTRPATLQAAWDTCPRGDWLDWLVDRECGAAARATYDVATATALAAYDDAIRAAVPVCPVEEP